MNNTSDYDNYARHIAELNRLGQNKAHDFIEKPAMYSLLPDLKGMNVLSAGCGTGEECLELHRRSAKVFGFDISAASVELAKTICPECKLEVMDMHNMNYKDNFFDFVYSGLVIHYSDKADEVLQEMYRVLKPGGQALLSTLHPIKWSAQEKRDAENEAKKAFILGYDSYQKPSKVYGDYFSTRRRKQKPADYPDIEYWVRPISAYFALIKSSGFTLIDFIEPKPVPHAKEIDPDYWEVQSKIPQFMIFKLKK